MMMYKPGDLPRGCTKKSRVIDCTYPDTKYPLFWCTLLLLWQSVIFMENNMENGIYYIDLTTEGGSGKAYIASPAKVTVKDGKMTAELVWSSPNYDYMEIGGIGYSPVNKSGNSIFEVAIDALDTDIPAKAETIAMSKPHMIDYTLHFNSSAIKSENGGINPVMWICIGAAVLCAAAAVWVIGRRKRNAK